jgi:peptide/nickel transport system substrate-binding protein
MAKPSTVVERYVIRQNIHSDATYGTWAKQAQDLFAGGKTLDDPEGKTLNTNFQQFRPKDLIVTGPFKIDGTSITNAQMTLPGVSTSWIANQVGFAKIVNFNGETPVITPVVLAKQVDYATHGFPPATEQAFKQAGIRIMRPPTYSGPALFINYDKLKDFGDKRVRQAIAMVIDRNQNGTVALGDSGKGVKYETGFSDNLVPLWLSQSDIGKLNTYDLNPDKATQLLTAAGWKKSGDTWTTPSGQPAQYELLFPAEYADWSASAQNAAEQLTKFGIKVTTRAITYTQQPIEVDKGNFQLAIQSWGSGSNPHPEFAFDTDLFAHNTRAANNGGKGIAFDLKQTTDSVGAVDMQQLVLDSGSGLDVNAQKAAITKLALAFNELLPIIPLLERYGNNAVLENVRVKGWPPDSDPIVQNSLYADNFVVMMILTGQLQPV